MTIGLESDSQDSFMDTYRTKTRGKLKDIPFPDPIPTCVPISKLKGLKLAMPVGPKSLTTEERKTVVSKTLPILLQRSKSVPERRHLSYCLVVLCFKQQVLSLIQTCMNLLKSRSHFLVINLNNFPETF